MSQPAAAVIDLEAFRRRRQMRTERPRGSLPPLAAVVVLPVMVTWIPIWPVR